MFSSIINRDSSLNINLNNSSQLRWNETRNVICFCRSLPLPLGVSFLIYCRGPARFQPAYSSESRTKGYRRVHAVYFIYSLFFWSVLSSWRICARLPWLPWRIAKRCNLARTQGPGRAQTIMMIAESLAGVPRLQISFSFLIRGKSQSCTSRTFGGWKLSDAHFLTRQLLVTVE